MVRRNLTGVDTTDKEFRPLAAVPTYPGSETHGGEDVAVYASGEIDFVFQGSRAKTNKQENRIDKKKQTSKTSKKAPLNINNVQQSSEMEEIKAGADEKMGRQTKKGR